MPISTPKATPKALIVTEGGSTTLPCPIAHALLTLGNAAPTMAVPIPEVAISTDAFFEAVLKPLPDLLHLEDPEIVWRRELDTKVRQEEADAGGIPLRFLLPAGMSPDHATKNQTAIDYASGGLNFLFTPPELPTTPTSSTSPINEGPMTTDTPPPHLLDQLAELNGLQMKMALLLTKNALRELQTAPENSSSGPCTLPDFERYVKFAPIVVRGVEKQLALSHKFPKPPLPKKLTPTPSLFLQYERYFQKRVRRFVYDEKYILPAEYQQMQEELERLRAQLHDARHGQQQGAGGDISALHENEDGSEEDSDVPPLKPVPNRLIVDGPAAGPTVWPTV